MKKFWMMLLAAVALTGCQKSEDVVADTNQITIKATMRFDAAARTTIKEQDGNYLARWTEEDKDNIRLVGISSDGGIWAIDAKDIHLENDGETATFEFAMYPEMMAESFTFVAVNSFAHYGSNSEAVWLQLKDAQTQDGQNYYDAHADLVVSKPIPVEQLTGDLNLNFTMARMNALLKLSLKNFTLAEEEKIQSVTFACEQPLAGIITVNLADLDGVTYPIPYTLHGEESKSITFDLQAGGDLYISTLPATLKAGESYTVTVKTNQATYHKVATLPADLTLTAGDITSVAVNMGDAATKTNVLRFNDAYEYVITCKAADGNTYLMSRNQCNRRPAAKSLASLGLSLNESGSLVGLVPDEFRWKAKAVATENEGEYETEFYYTLDGITYNLIVTSNAQGIAVNSELSGYYTNPYTKTIVVKENGDGYALMNTNAATPYSLYVNNATDFRFAQAASNQDVVYFCRIQDAPQKSLYPVITKAENVTDGTYAILYHYTHYVLNEVELADNKFYALKNEAIEKNAIATAAENVVVELDEEYCVTNATIADDYKWIIVKTTKDSGESYYQIKSAKDGSLWLWHRDNAAGVAVAKIEELSGSFVAKWHFANHMSYGLQMYGDTHTRYAIARTASDVVSWGTLSGPTGTLVLVKLSDSTKQIAENE